jgi:hypothetical protein
MNTPFQSSCGNRSLETSSLKNWNEILRPTVVEGKYKFIKECDAHGLMDGEVLKSINLETNNFVTFTLV